MDNIKSPHAVYLAAVRAEKAAFDAAAAAYDAAYAVPHGGVGAALDALDAYHDARAVLDAAHATARAALDALDAAGWACPLC